MEDQEINTVVPSGLQYEISMDVDTPALLDLVDVRFRTKIRALVKKLPGFRFSAYRSVAFFGEIPVSMAQLAHMIKKKYETITDPVAIGKINKFFDDIP